jgi:hypothetical protein
LEFFEAHDFLGRFVHFVFLGHQFLPQQADQRIISHTEIPGRPAVRAHEE